MNSSAAFNRVIEVVRGGQTGGVPSSRSTSWLNFAKSYDEREIADAAAKLRVEIESDRRELEILIDQLGIKKSTHAPENERELKLRLEDGY